MSALTQDDALVDRLKRRLSKVFGHKKLVEYFNRKGFTDFDEYVYPPMLQDLPMIIQEFRNKVEITPFSQRVDPTTGVVMIGWNMFVLGINRSFLGYSYHQSAQDLKRAFGARPELPHEPKKRVRDVIDFIVETLDKNRDGLLDPVMVGLQPSRAAKVDGYAHQGMASSPGSSGGGSGYERPTPVN